MVYSKIKVVVIEDDDIIRNGFVILLNKNEKFVCVANYNNCENAIKNLQNDLPDIILMDIGLPGMSGIDGTRKIKKRNPTIDVIVVTVHEEDSKIFLALCNGASGYITKNITPKKLFESIEEIFKGGAPMSTGIARRIIQSVKLNKNSPFGIRETEILQLLGKGKSYSMIADKLSINKETVRIHIKNIYKKLSVNSKSRRTEKTIRRRHS